MTDRSVVGIALSCWLGALVPLPVPVFMAIAFLGAAFALPCPPAGKFLACAVLASALAVAPGLALTASESDTSGHESVTVTLTSDPRPITRGMRASVHWAGDEWDLVAWGSAAGHLRGRLLGETLSGTVAIRPHTRSARWNDDTVGSMTLETVAGAGTGWVHHRLSNGVRRTIESGAESLSREHRVLLGGFVYGDDRFQDDLTADDFSASGLTHLLAVSGSNVAFMLVLVGPLLRRFDFAGRLALTLVVLFLFATLTRYEPSVMRASAMAAVAALAVSLGRRATSIRFLSLAVAGLILWSPSLVHSLGFQLSALATIGIVALGPEVAQRIAGPRVLAEAVAVTVSAQIAVAPLLIYSFDRIPVASLPANVAAGPLAGPIMMWGLTAGIAAGVLGGTAAQMLHIPTAVMLGMVQWIASAGARAPLGFFGPVHVVIGSVAIFFLVRSPQSWLRRTAAIAAGLVLLHPALVTSTTGPSSVNIGDGTMVWADENSTVVALGGAPLDELLLGLRVAGVTHIDAVALPRAGYADWSRLRTVRRRWSVDEVWAATDDVIAEVDLITEPFSFTIRGNEGLVRVRVVPDDPRLSLSEASN